jgi:hypothetical protein
MRFLTDDLKHQCLSICKDLHQSASNSAVFLSIIVSGDESLIYSYVLRQSNIPPMKRSKLAETDKGKTGEEQSQDNTHSFDFSKNLSWQAIQSVLHTTAMFYDDYVKMCENFAPNFNNRELATASQQCTISLFLFHQENF